MKKMIIKKCLEIGERGALKNFVRNYKSVYSMCMLEHLIEDGDPLDESNYFCENKCEVKSMCNLALCTCLL